jgi:hypothetical protein
MKFFILVISIFLVSCGCKEYASGYSCSYVEDKAEYDVYYWKNVLADREEGELLVGHTKGLRSCKNMAINYAKQVNENWNDRAYICVLVDDGRNKEKHRLLDY